MAKYLKLFNNHSEYTAFTQTEEFVKPNVSHCIQENEVHYNPYIAPLTVTYNVTDASEPTKLYFYYDYEGNRGVDHFENIVINGNNVSVADIDIAEGKYQLSEGEYTVKYTLKDQTSIGDSAFFGCTSVTDAEIPNSVTYINNNVFQGCTGLTNVTIPDSVTSIGNSAFYGCTSLSDVTIPDSVTSIGNSAFNGCASLSAVTIPDSVTDIQGFAFSNCVNIETVTVGNGVTYISNSVFNGCASLSAVTIPDSVTEIGKNTFRYCESLVSIVCNAISAPTIRNDTFSYVKTNGTLTVPQGSTGYDAWMSIDDYYLGKYGWTKVEQ